MPSRYCDVSLPVPLDRPFTYSLPTTLQHRVHPGARIVVPFGPRKLTGVILACHNLPPASPLKEALRLIDPEPVLSPEMIALARWISAYYCSALGEVLRSMLPLGSEIRSGKVFSLTDSGRDAAPTRGQIFSRNRTLRLLPDYPPFHRRRRNERGSSRFEQNGSFLEG